VFSLSWFSFAKGEAVFTVSFSLRGKLCLLTVYSLLRRSCVLVIVSYLLRGKQFITYDFIFEPNSYRGALLSTLLHATEYMYTCFTQFAECTSTDCK
jgi:hypothetical protein